MRALRSPLTTGLHPCSNLPNAKTLRGVGWHAPAVVCRSMSARAILGNLEGIPLNGKVECSHFRIFIGL
jgi:hypothetical protein